MPSLAHRLKDAYRAAEAAAKERPLLSGLGITVLGQLLAPTSVLAFLQAALVTLLTHGSLIVGLVAGSGFAPVVGKWLAVHFGAYVIAMVLGMPPVWLVSKNGERWPRRVWMPLLALGLITMLGIRASAAVWLWENVAGLPRWFAIPWVLGNFATSVMLRAIDSGQNTAKIGRLAAVSVQLSDQAGDPLLVWAPEEPFVYVVGAPADDDLDREIDGLVRGRRVGASGSLSFSIR